MTLKMSGIRYALACLLAAVAASCQIPESERIPAVFTLTPETITPPALTEGIQIIVECDLHWSVQLLDPEWGSIEYGSIQEGKGGEFRFQMGANLEDAPRENTVIVKAGKSEERITITQDGLEQFFSPRSLDIQGTDPYTVSFQSPATWSVRVTKGEDWLTLRTSGGGVGAARLTVAARDANENVGEREAMVSVSIGPHLLDIPVRQAQKDVVLPGESAISLPFDATEISIKTRYNVDYTVSTTASWIQWEKTKAPLYESTEHFTVSPNLEQTSRSGEFRFVSEEHSCANYTVSVTQEGKDPILSVTVPGFYGMDSSDYVFGSDGWNQASFRTSADGSVRYVLFHQKDSRALVLEGFNAAMGREETARLTITSYDKAQENAQETTHNARLLFKDENLYWFASTVKSGVYFIVKK